MKTNRKYFKKKANIGTWILSIIVLILVGGLAYASSGFMNWDLESWKDQFTLPVVPGSSSEETPNTSEEAVFDIANRPNHIMYAVNDTVVLTVTVTPANAANKTVVWTSSNPSYVTVTPLTENTARLTCVANFYGSVVITATATQGTSYTGDDVTATCTVTYDHPLESIDIQLWNYGATPAMNGGAAQVTTTTEITDFTNWYALRVFLTPALPSQSGYSFSNLELEIEEYTTITDISQYESGEAFKFVYSTPPESVIEVKVLSDDNEHLDTIAITIGQHLGVAGRVITGSVQVWSNDRATMLNSYASFAELIVAVQTQGKSWLAGSYIYINVNGMDYVNSNYDILFSTTYFGYVAAGSVNITNHSSGVARVTNPANNATLVLYALVSTGGTINVTIDPTYYSSTFLNHQLPFVLTEPVTGLSIDQPNVTF
jgi:hypothetical protein